MDKNTLTAFLLMAAVLIAFTFISQPSAEQQAAYQRQQDSIAQEQKKQQELSAKRKAAIEAEEQQAIDTSSAFAAATKGKEQIVTLHNKDLRVDVSTKGARVSRVQILGYKDQSRKHPVTLFRDKEESLKFTFTGKQENIETNMFYFKPVNVTDTSVTMRLMTADSAYLDFNYTLANRYFVNLSITSRKMQNNLLPSVKTVSIEWKQKLRQQERGYKFENQYSALTYKIKEKSPKRLDTQKDEEKEADEALDWIAFKNQFFSSVFIADQDFKHSQLSSKMLEHKSGYLKDYSASAETFFDPTGAKPTTMQFFFGPNQFRLLQKMDKYSTSGKELDLERLVYLGWPLFRLINRYFTIYIFDGLRALGLPMGIILLLITILLRCIVYIPTKKSMLSSIKMRVLKPKVDEINAKYPKPEDNMKKQQEIMTMYSRYGVSPMGGCLPILVQMPIWIAMFNFIPNSIELRQQSFLWADDLSTYDAILSWNKDIWLIGDHISLFCLLFCVTNLLYSWFNMRIQKDTMAMSQPGQMTMMKVMTYGMPIFFFFLFNDYSSGLNYYYFISLLAGAFVMWYIRHTTDEKKVLAQLEENYKANKSNPKKMSGFAQRLEQMQKMQEERLKEAQNRGQKH